MGRILIVDDEPHMRRILVSNLEQDRHVVSQASGVGEARNNIATHDYEVIVTDQKMTDGEGMDVLAVAREADPTVSVVFLTAFASIELAVESMRRGAFDFVAKPFAPEVLRATVKRACERTQLLRENDLLKDAFVRLEGAPEIFGDSPGLREVKEKIARVAPTSATVLITGETGTGKELVARAIHRNSPRASKPFVAVNCAAVTETLLESELFGHERGAFTGADRARQGLFEAAHEGTLFLDEAGEMSMAAQAKLLRVLTDGQLLRVGSTKPREVDVRVLVATHRDLEQRVREGSFRDDLFYRLAVVPIALPPLRQRREDIPGLCELFSRQVAKELKLQERRISSSVLEKLQKYSFPGNIRELRNLVERAYILSNGGELGPNDFPLLLTEAPNEGNGDETNAPRWIVSVPEKIDLRDFLAKTEKQLILRALKASGGAQADAARQLGISRSDMSYKLAKYGISVSND
jgi:two-component system response regulator HydG